MESKKKKLAPEEIRNQLLMPRRTAEAFQDLSSVRQAFALPVTLGTSEDNRLAMDDAFDSAGGFETIYSSLTQHAGDMGQFPMTSFIGYGALQQIAQQGMIRACISTVADDMAKKWIELKGSDDKADKLAELADIAENQYHLKKVFHEAFSTAGYMGGAFIFIDTGADDDLTLPLAINNNSAELTEGSSLRFTVIDPINVCPAEYNADNPLRPDYMMPRSWFVLGRKVHASRLIRIVDNEPPMLLRPSYNFLGIPQAQLLWDYVLHFNECRTYTANLLRKISLLVVKTDTDAVLSDPNGIATLDAKMEMLSRYRDNDSVFVCDKDSEDVSNVQTTISGCTDIVKQCLEMICALDRVPAVKLLGISPSGFNSTGESDIKNYCEHISAKQELHHDAIQRCLKAIQLAEFGEIDSSITFKFVPLDVESEASTAMTAQTRIGSWGQLLDRQVISAEEMREAVKKDESIGLEFIDEEMPEELLQAQNGEGDMMGGMGGMISPGEDKSASKSNLLEEMMANAKAEHDAKTADSKSD